jgi:CRISPR system Cascade subunit CasD
MGRHLVFTLAAPMGSFSIETAQSAGTARRSTELDPPKSAVAGLLAAACGRPREDIPGIARSIQVSTATVKAPFLAGRPDYHTITLGGRPEHLSGAARASTRFEELRRALSHPLNDGSVLSSRDYWTGGIWTVAIAAADEAIDRFAAALARPKWVLVAGRRAFVLGLPPEPIVVMAESAVEAHRTYRRQAAGLTAMMHTWVGPDERSRIANDLSYPGRPLLGREVTRRDVPLRASVDELRTFAARTVFISEERLGGPHG